MRLTDFRWARHPGDGHTHAIAPTDLASSGAAVEALCGARLPAEGLDPREQPWGLVCLPCVIGATDGEPDPGRMGTAL